MTVTRCVHYVLHALWGYDCGYDCLAVSSPRCSKFTAVQEMILRHSPGLIVGWLGSPTRGHRENSPTRLINLLGIAAFQRFSTIDTYIHERQVAKFSYPVASANPALP